MPILGRVKVHWHFLMRQIAVANREARARWILAYVGGNALRHSREVPQPYDRHTQGTYWHMRSDTLALATDTLAHTRRRGCTNEATQLAGTLSLHRPGTFK